MTQHPVRGESAGWNPAPSQCNPLNSLSSDTLTNTSADPPAQSATPAHRKHAVLDDGTVVRPVTDWMVKRDLDARRREGRGPRTSAALLLYRELAADACPSGWTKKRVKGAAADGQQTLAELTLLSVRTLRTAQQELEDLGMIRVVRGRTKGGRQAGNTFVLTVGLGAVVAPWNTENGSQGAQAAPGQGAVVAPWTPSDTCPDQGIRDDFAAPKPSCSKERTKRTYADASLLEGQGQEQGRTEDEAGSRWPARVESLSSEQRSVLKRIVVRAERILGEATQWPESAVARDQPIVGAIRSMPTALENGDALVDAIVRVRRAGQHGECAWGAPALIAALNDVTLHAAATSAPRGATAGNRGGSSYDPRTYVRPQPPLITDENREAILGGPDGPPDPEAKARAMAAWRSRRKSAQPNPFTQVA